MTTIDLSYIIQDRKRGNMNNTRLRTNPYSGQSSILTVEEAKLYDKIKQDEIDENYTNMQKGLDKFSRLNVKAYMTLLD